MKALQSLLRCVLVASGLCSAGAPAAFGAPFPPCTPEQYSASQAQTDARESFRGPQKRYDMRPVPSKVPFGRTIVADVYADPEAHPSSENPTVLSLQADSGQPLAHPYTRSFGDEASDDVEFDWWTEVPIRLERADGPARLVMTFNHMPTFGPACRATIVSDPVIPVEPSVRAAQRPRRVRVDRRGRTQGVRLSLDLSSCGESKPLRITARMGRSKLRLTTRDCRLSGRRQARGTGLQLRGSGSTVKMWVRRAARFVGVVRYEVSYGAKRVRSGLFRVSGLYHRGYPSRRIYDTQFDDFVNICINEGYQTFASGGRLYCSVPGDPSYYYQRVSRIR